MTFVCGFMIKSWYTHPLKSSWHTQTIVNVFLNRKYEVELVGLLRRISEELVEYKKYDPNILYIIPKEYIETLFQ